MKEFTKQSEQELTQILGETLANLIRYCKANDNDNPSIKVEAEIKETGEKYELKFERKNKWSWF